MIPEFPLPTVDADFYKSQIYELPPIFGHTLCTPQLVEPTELFARNAIVNPIQSNSLLNAVKTAAIQQRLQVQKMNNVQKMQTKPKVMAMTTTNFSSRPLLSSVFGSLLVTQ